MLVPHTYLTSKAKFPRTLLLDVSICPARQLIHQILSGNEGRDFSLGNELANFRCCGCLYCKSLGPLVFYYSIESMRCQTKAAAVMKGGRSAAAQACPLT